MKFLFSILGNKVVYKILTCCYLNYKMNESHKGRGRSSNPWNRGGGRGGHNQNHAIRKKPSPEVLAQNKFHEAQARLQASVQKHIKQEYDSSSEEEELESDSILGERLLYFVILVLYILIIHNHSDR
jgi:hypothetical protein